MIATSRVSVSSLVLTARKLSTSIAVNNVASVLKLNIKDEPTAVKFDGLMKSMTEKMKGSPGMISATRHVCKSEWAYELSFVWDSKENFGAWKESPLREEVHEDYLKALEEVGIKEEEVYGGARVSDVWV